MKSIIAIIPNQCLGFGGSFSVYEGLSLLPEISLQTFENFAPIQDTKLVIGFGYTPPRKEGFNYKTSFLFCSPILQCEFSNELNLLNGKIQEVNKGILDYLFLLHKPDADALSSIWGEKIRWLPPLFNKKLPEPQFERKGICCAGMNRGNKNYYNQALAIAISKYKDQGLYTFGDKPEVFRLSKSIFNQDWCISDWILQNDKYYDILKKMKLGLQVSLSESFNYITLELALLKIPSIVSPSIYWYAQDSMLNEECVIKNSNDPIEIKTKIDCILTHSGLYSNLCERSYDVAQQVLKNNFDITKKVLEELICG